MEGAMKRGGWEAYNFDAGYPRYIGAEGPAPRIDHYSMISKAWITGMLRA